MMMMMVRLGDVSCTTMIARRKKNIDTHRQGARPHQLDRTGAAPQPVPGNLWLLSQKVSWCLKYPPTKKLWFPILIRNPLPSSTHLMRQTVGTSLASLPKLKRRAETWPYGGQMVDRWWISTPVTHIFVDRLVSFHNFSSHPTKSTEANGYRSRTNSGIHPYIQVPHNNGRCLAHKHTRRIYMIIQYRPANICDIII